MQAILKMTLLDKRELEFQTQKLVAEAILKNHQNGGVFYFIENGVGMSVDFRDVIAVQVIPDKSQGNFADNITAIQRQVMPNEAQSTGGSGSAPATPIPIPVSTTIKSPELIGQSTLQKSLCKIECKCGADYYCTLFNETKGCRCRDCGENVFVDNFAPKRTDSYNRAATLITNRYRVPFINERQECNK